jgi:hypothetical protein
MSQTDTSSPFLPLPDGIVIASIHAETNRVVVHIACYRPVSSLWTAIGANTWSLCEDSCRPPLWRSPCHFEAFSAQICVLYSRLLAQDFYGAPQQNQRNTTEPALRFPTSGLKG